MIHSTEEEDVSKHQKRQDGIRYRVIKKSNELTSNLNGFQIFDIEAKHEENNDEEIMCNFIPMFRSQLQLQEEKYVYDIFVEEAGEECVGTVATLDWIEKDFLFDSSSEESLRYSDEDSNGMMIID